MSETTRVRPSIFTGTIIVFVLLCMLVFGVYYELQDKVLFLLIPGLFGLAILNDFKTTLKTNKILMTYVLLVCLALTSVFYNNFNFELYINSSKFLIGTLFACYIPLGLNKNRKYEDFFHIGFILSILGLIFIEYTQGNFKLFGFETGKIGRDKFIYNANYYSYVCYFANFSLFYLHLKYKNIITTSSLIILPILFIILTFITQSRAGLLLIIFINGLFWFIIDKSTKTNIFYRLSKNFLIILATVIFSLQLINTYQNSQIKNRMDKSADDPRGDLAQQAMAVFADHPFIGVGLGQFPRYNKSGLFSHNSYTEILAEHGVIGGILLLILFGIPTFKSLKNLRLDSKNSFNRLNFLFFTTFILYNNAYVFYKANFAMLFFFLIVSIQNNSSEGEKKTQLNTLE